MYSCARVDLALFPGSLSPFSETFEPSKDGRSGNENGIRVALSLTCTVHGSKLCWGGGDCCYCSLTTTKDPKSGAVVFLNPLISLLDEHAYGSRSSVEVSDLQSLHHLPVPP